LLVEGHPSGLGRPARVERPVTRAYGSDEQSVFTANPFNDQEAALQHVHEDLLPLQEIDGPFASIGEGGDAIREALESTRQPIGIYDRSLGVDEHAHRSVFSQLGQNLFTIIVQQFGAQE
jgi:hypothetical protein